MFAKILAWSGGIVSAAAVAGCSMLAGEQFGAAPEGSDLRRISASPNHDGEVFRNQVQGLKPDASLSTWEMAVGWFSNRGARKPEQALPVRKLRKLRVGDGETHVTWMGHSTLLIELDGKLIMTDPVFSGHASPYSWLPPKSFYAELPVRLEEVGWLDVVVISHDHYDHLDHKTMKALSGRVGKFLVPLGVGSHLRHWGVPAERIRELDWWQEAKVGDVTFTATPAQHFSGRSLTGGKQTLWAGWAIRGTGENLFFSGDTAYFPGFREIGERLGPFDLTLLECGAYNPAWSNVHMYPEQTAQAHLDLGGGRLMPIHWGRFDLAMHGWTEPVERLAAAAESRNINLVQPRIGERFELSGSMPRTAWWREEPIREIQPDMLAEVEEAG